MKKGICALIVLSLLLPCCVRKKTAQAPKKISTHQSGERADDKKGTYDDDAGAFVLDDDADYDVFDTNKPVAKKAGVVGAAADAAAKKDERSDDSWAWEELDEEQPTKVINFEYDSARIKPEEQPKVRYNAELAKFACKDGATVVIEGHSCLITRSEEYNQVLSQRRADRVKGEFKKLGVDQNCMKSVGRGTSQLLTRADGKLGQAPNRRVEVKFVHQKKN